MDVARQDSALRHKPGFSWGNRGAYRGSRWAPLDPRAGSPPSGPEARKKPTSSQVVSPPHTLPPAVCPASHQGRGLFLEIPIFPFIYPSAPLAALESPPKSRLSSYPTASPWICIQSPPEVTARSSGPLSGRSGHLYSLARLALLKYHPNHVTSHDPNHPPKDLQGPAVPPAC